MHVRKLRTKLWLQNNEGKWTEALNKASFKKTTTLKSIFVDTQKTRSVGPCTRQPVMTVAGATEARTRGGSLVAHASLLLGRIHLSDFDRWDTCATCQLVSRTKAGINCRGWKGTESRHVKTTAKRRFWCDSLSSFFPSCLKQCSRLRPALLHYTVIRIRWHKKILNPHNFSLFLDVASKMQTFNLKVAWFPATV